ncbi:MAG: hypothetical protein BRC25_02925 [Parcubacteria group bacterium SW_6_46_9]|nr:MAG: hypothetical protein BRC25_02925 [Parcubacteria group bacterium SW_6_46_9]
MLHSEDFSSQPDSSDNGEVAVGNGDTPSYVASSDGVDPQPATGFWGRLDSGQVVEEIRDSFTYRPNGEVGMHQSKELPNIDEEKRVRPDVNPGDADSQHHESHKENATIEADTKVTSNDDMSGPKNPDELSTANGSSQEDEQWFNENSGEDAPEEISLSDVAKKLGVAHFPDNIPDGVDNDYSRVPDTLKKLKRMFTEDRDALEHAADADDVDFSRTDFYRWQDTVFFRIEELARDQIKEGNVQSWKEILSKENIPSFFDARKEIKSLLETNEHDRDRRKNELLKKYNRLNAAMKRIARLKNNGRTVSGAGLGDKAHANENYFFTHFNIPDRNVKMRSADSGHEIHVNVLKAEKAAKELARAEKPFSEFDLKKRIEDGVGPDRVWEEIKDGGLYLCKQGPCFVKGKEGWTKYESFKAYQDQDGEKIIQSEVDSEVVRRQLEQDTEAVKEVLEAAQEAAKIKSEAPEKRVTRKRDSSNWNIGDIYESENKIILYPAGAENVERKPNSFKLVDEKGQSFADRFAVAELSQKSDDSNSGNENNAGVRTVDDVSSFHDTEAVREVIRSSDNPEEAANKLVETGGFSYDKSFDAIKQDSGEWVFVDQEGNIRQNFQWENDGEFIEKLKADRIDPADTRQESQADEKAGQEQQEDTGQLSSEEILSKIASGLEDNRELESVYREIWQKAKKRGGFATLDGGAYARKAEEKREHP